MPVAAHGPPPQRLPKTRAVDRVEYLCRLARGRSTIHVGFVGLGRAGSPPRPWLHGSLDEVAARLIGIDRDRVGVEVARSEGYEAYVADCTDRAGLEALGLPPADVVIAGEIIEHLESPGAFLDAAHLLVAPEGRLVVTTPNAASLLNVLAAMGRYELSHPDHVGMYSFATLTNLLRRHGWAPQEIVTYHGLAPSGPSTPLHSLGRLASSIQRAAARVWPFLDFGLIAVAARK